MEGCIQPYEQLQNTIKVPDNLGITLGGGEAKLRDNDQISHELKNSNGEFEYSLKAMVTHNQKTHRSEFMSNINQLIRNNKVTSIEFNVDAAIGGQLNGVNRKGEFIDKITCKFKIDEPGKSKIHYVGITGDYKYLTGSTEIEKNVQKLKSSYDITKAEAQLKLHLIGNNYQDDKKYAIERVSTEDVVTLSQMQGYSKFEAAIVRDNSTPSPKKPDVMGNGYGEKPQSYESLSVYHRNFIDKIVRKNCPRLLLQDDNKGVDVVAENKLKSYISKMNTDPIFKQGCKNKFGIDNVKVYIGSSYRSPKKQFEEFFENKLGNPISKFYKDGMSEGSAEYKEVEKQYTDRMKRVAPPGYSEHHNGKTFDLGYYVDSNNNGTRDDGMTRLGYFGTECTRTPGNNSDAESKKTFDKYDPGYKRFSQNAKNDFSESYPANGPYSKSICEPWHWMYNNY